MVRNVDYASRRKIVLTKTILKYIQEAEPVASEDIAKDFDLSSATIRNIFSDLEDSGFLTHLYTSGGRVPTDKGYRYYVDFLISQIELLDEEKRRIERQYQREISQLEDVLERTSQIISDITHYAGIVSSLEWNDKFFYKGISHIFEQPEFQNLERMRLLIKAIEEKQKLLDVINRDFQEDELKIYIGRELGCPGMDSCSLVVSSYRVKNKPSGRLAVLGPMRMEYENIIAKVEFMSDVLTEVLDNI